MAGLRRREQRAAPLTSGVHFGPRALTAARAGRSKCFRVKFSVILTMRFIAVTADAHGSATPASSSGVLVTADDALAVCEALPAGLFRAEAVCAETKSELGARH